MSSLSDVQNAMVAVINAAVYPTGYTNPSIAGVPIFVNPGDFQKEDLDAGLLAGSIYVPVFGVKGMTRSTTRVRRQFVQPIINAPHLTLTVSGDNITVGGTIVANEAAMVIVNGVGYSVQVLIGSTTSTIASALAVKIPGSVAAANVITISGVYDIIARVSVQGTAREILYSREGMFRARVIAPNHALRELVGDAIDIAFGLNGYYMPVPDGIKVSIRPSGIQELNPYELDNAFLRDYMYLVEYHTVYVGTYQSIADTPIDFTVQIPPIT